MKYVCRSDSGAFEFASYEEYLEQAREPLAALIHGAELLTIARFSLSGPESFHDARFESFLVRLAPSSHGDPVVAAELRLKGPYFDRQFELHYEDVGSCTFSAPGPEDDLLIHEIREESGHLVHEFEFDGDKQIAITCRRMRFVEVLAV